MCGILAQCPPRLTTYIYEQNSYIPLARIEQAKDEKSHRIYHYHCNASGQPEEITDSAGNTIWRARYATWGKTFFENTTQYAPTGFEQNLRMQGQYADRETGLYYNTFRYYDADTGRFITEDPIGLSGGLNLYQYAPNPLAWIDPWGWCVTANVTRGSQGQPLQATARITKADLDTGTGTNASSRAAAQRMGNARDDAGHIIGRRLGGSGGVEGVFPQNSGINRGAFAQFEGQVAKKVNELGEVDVKTTFDYANGGTRPTSIKYEVFDTSGRTILENVFRN